MTVLPKHCQISLVKSSTAKQGKIQKSDKRTAWPKLREIRYKNGTKVWSVDTRIMRDVKVVGDRHFFKTKAEAETKADQLRTQRKNEGESALALAVDPVRKSVWEIRNSKTK